MRITRADFDFWGLYRAPRWWQPPERLRPLQPDRAIHAVINGHASDGAREPDNRRVASNMIHTLRQDRQHQPRTILLAMSLGDGHIDGNKRQYYARRWLRRLEQSEMQPPTRRGGR